MLTRRERERAEANRAAFDLVRQSVAPHLRAAGFRKASINTWRRDHPEIAVRFQLELGCRSALRPVSPQPRIPPWQQTTRLAKATTNPAALATRGTPPR